MDTKEQPIEELVICRLTTTPDNPEFLKALELSDRWLAEQPGFLWRIPGFTTDGRLVDRCGWASESAAHAAAAGFMDSEAGKILNAFLDPEGIVFLHYRPREAV